MEIRINMRLPSEAIRLGVLLNLVTGPLPGLS